MNDLMTIKDIVVIGLGQCLGCHIRIVQYNNDFKGDIEMVRVADSLFE